MKKKILILILVLSFVFIGCQVTESTSNVEDKTNNNNEVIETTNVVDDNEIDNSEEEIIEDEINFRAKVTVDVLNLRVDANIDAEKLGEVYKDSVYQVMAYETINLETWYKISVGDGHEGWVAGWFCDETTEAPIETNIINIPGLVLESFYGLNDALVVSEVTTPEFPYEIYINGIVVEGSYTFEEVGSYDYYSKLYDELGRSVITKTRYITVVEFADGLCYESVTLDDDNKVVHTLELPLDPDLIVGVVLDYKDSSMVWYEIKPDNKEVCYYPSREMNIAYKRYDHVVIMTPEKRYEFSDMALIPKSDYVEEGYYIFEGDKIVILNQGDKLVYESPADYRFLDSHSFVSYTDVNNYNFRENDFFTLEILELKDGKLISQYVDEIAYMAMEFFKDDDNTIRVYGYGESNNDWDFAPESVLKDEATYQKVDGIWSKTITESEFTYKNPVTLIDVYSSIDSDSAIVSTVELETLKEIDYLGNYDIIDGELVMWFRVVLSDDSTGYTYRSRLSYESGFILGGQSVALIMDDGSKKNIDITSGFMWDIQTHINGSLTHYDIYLESHYYEGASHTAYNKKLGEEVNLPFNSYILNSPNKKWFVGTEEYLEEIVHKMGIYDFVNNEFVELYSFSSENAFPAAYEWESDTILNFKLYVNEERYPASLTLIDDVWVLETEYDLEN